MKLRDQYDWIVLGDHPGALLSAGLAARLGLSVLILPVFEGKSLCLAEDGRFVDLETNFMLGLGRVPRFSGLLSECLSRLGILPAELEQIDGGKPLPQILTPSLRMEFSAEDERLSHALARELGKGVATHSGLMQALKKSEGDTLSYWLQLPDRLTLSPEKKKRPASLARIADLRDLRRKLSKDVASPAQGRWHARDQSAARLGRELKHPELVQLLSGFWFGATGTTLEDVPLEDFLHLLIVARTCASYRGGMSSYREFLIRLAKRLGAHAPAKLECKRIFVDKGRFTGVQVANRANVVAGNGAVAGCALSQLGTLVSMSTQSWWNRLKSSPEALGWRFTICFTVDASAIPPGCSPHLVWQEAEAPPLEIEITDAEPVGAASGRRSQQRALMVRTVLPFAAETLAPEYQRRVAARMLRQLAEIFPFLEKHLKSAYPEFRGPRAEPAYGELSEVYGFAKLEDIPENLRCLPPRKGAGVGSRSGIEGLFVASGESFPELGSLGSTVAALESVSWLAHRGGLAGPFA